MLLIDTGIHRPGAPGEDVPFHTSPGVVFGPTEWAGSAICLFQKRTLRRTELKNLIVIVFALLLVSCAAGPVYVAKTESEGIKDSYDDFQLRTMYERNRPLLHEVYTRLTSSHIHVYPEGLGFVTVQIVPAAHLPHGQYEASRIVFDMITTKADQRVSTVLKEYLEKYLTYVKVSDIQLRAAEGLSLGVYWPVRNHLQCHENGGFIEYVTVSLSKDDLTNIFGGKTTLKNLLSTREIVCEFDLKEPVHMKPAY